MTIHVGNVQVSMVIGKNTIAHVCLCNMSWLYWSRSWFFKSAVPIDTTVHKVPNSHFTFIYFIHRFSHPKNNSRKRICLVDYRSDTIISCVLQCVVLPHNSAITGTMYILKGAQDQLSSKIYVKADLNHRTLILHMGIDFLNVYSFM